MKLIGPFTQLLPLRKLPLRGALQDNAIEIIHQGGLLIENGKIRSIGKFDELRKQFNNEVEIVEIEQEAVCLPGFIDSHTHICSAGTRANDFAMRNAGKTYLEIAKEGGGIWSTVQQTRAASQEQLEKLIILRTHELAKQGITTIEVKSGYGLSVEEELKMLRAIKNANNSTAQNLVSTCLAAHTLPKDFDGTHTEYLELMAAELFPILEKEQLTNRIDAFVEEEAFNEKNTHSYFEEAKKYGFDITVHADQFSTGGSELAVNVGAVSADHLEVSKEKEIELLANSNTVATALPGASIGLGVEFTPARKLLDAGAIVSIASDWNPGSAPQGQLLAQASCLATYEKLSNAEVLAALTTRAAYALRLNNVGQLAEEFQANFSIFPTDNYQEITYQMGRLLPAQVWIDGTKITTNQA